MNWNGMGRDDDDEGLRQLGAVPATCSWRHSSTHHITASMVARVHRPQLGLQCIVHSSACSAAPTRSVLRACVRDWQGPDGDDGMGRGMGPRWKKAARQLDRQAREQPPCSFSGGHMGACDRLGLAVTPSHTSP
jgi:hypothetical protein